MAKRVIWTVSAWNDLEQIADYIAKDSPMYAAVFVGSAKKLARSLNRFTKRGRIVPEYGDPDIRELFIKSYRMLYKCGKQTVHILGIIHGARDLLAALDLEKRLP